MLAALWNEDGDLARALPLVEEALGIARALGDRQAEGHTLTHMAAALVTASRLDEAREAFLNSLAISRDLNDLGRTSHDDCHSLIGLGDIEASQGRDEAARAKFLEARDLARKAGCLHCEAVAWRRLAEQWYEHGQFNPAAAEAREAAVRFRALGYNFVAAHMVGLILRIEALEGQPERLDELRREIEQEARDFEVLQGKLGLHVPAHEGDQGLRELPAVPSDMAQLEYVAASRAFMERYNREAWTDALDCWGEFWGRASALGDPRLQAKALGLKGVAHFYAGQFGEAIAAFERALPLARSASLTDLESQLLRDLAQAQRKHGEPVHAARTYRSLIALCRRTGDPQGEFGAWGPLVILVQNDLNEPRATLDWLADGLDRLRQLGHPREAAVLAFLLGMAHFTIAEQEASGDNLRHREGALRYFGEALVLYGEVKDSDAQAHTWWAIGTAWMVPGIADFSEDPDEDQVSAAIDRVDAATDAFLNSARLRWQAGDRKAEGESLNLATEVSLSGLGICHKTGMDRERDPVEGVDQPVGGLEGEAGVRARR